jgi:hypothetical protein
LRFLLQTDLANFDPIWSNAYVVRNASAMVWDTALRPGRQAGAAAPDGRGREVTPDGLTRTFQLRPELSRNLDGNKLADLRFFDPTYRHIWVAYPLG